ncbi:uncharacterized protein VDAG_05296 [Verticillium dahliae VdLs.17]|uniref:Uncharacterized protein n=1 Tax=Verticillium dahliae (strain VdLs.17 / ATCC MYA-4575 / FGSC 10137) TaxID=498257 RepID=G2X5Y0_VERDV|nr:uncharacterized protein VDAG_05296 [Verticillium dahliae VdLs.17]EGY14132.1 hypothetical protein VDAG_05296 [Verticillium dahliae VdLs.17]KAH6672817.1 hypothetical protein EV126DRAFT_351733 [Verticillium dahliae]
MSSPLLCAGPGRAPGERIVALNATVYEFNPFELGPRRIIFGRVAGIKYLILIIEYLDLSVVGRTWIFFRVALLYELPNGTAAPVDRHLCCILGHELDPSFVYLKPLRYA